MRKLLTYLLRLTYAPYEEIPQPNPNESMDAYILRCSIATIHINIKSKKRDSLLQLTWNNAKKQEVKKVFTQIYEKHGGG